MKIAISTSVIQRGKTGVAQYVFALVRALMAHADEHEFHLLVLEEDLPLFAFAASKMTLVPVSEKWRPAVRNIIWHQMLLPLWLKKQGVDVLHVPSYRRLPWLKSCASVATIHDLAPFHVRGKYDLARMLYGRLLVKALARRQDEVIAVSSSTRRDIQRFFNVCPEKLSTILNGLDHERFNVGDPAAAKDFAVNHWELNAPYFLYVSRLEHPAKNHVRLIEAFNRFKAATGSDWQLALGGSDWHGAEKIHGAAKASPYAADIRFLGFVDDSALPDLYRAAGAFVYPSMFEGFGMPPIEAMACGCPVISSAAGSLEEVLGDAAHVIDPECATSIESGLTVMALNPAHREHLIRRGLKHAQRFSWDHNATQVMSVYRHAALLHDVGSRRLSPFRTCAG